jgi:hypothetical protein
MLSTKGLGKRRLSPVLRSRENEEEQEMEKSQYYRYCDRDSTGMSRKNVWNDTAAQATDCSLVTEA